MTELNTSLKAQDSQEITVTPLQSASSRPPTSSHQHTMRRLMWAGTFLMAVVVAALVVWWYLPPQLHGIPLQSPRIADDFTLPSSTGQSMSLSDFRGKYVV